jgi:general secretion pathway protein G
MQQNRFRYGFQKGFTLIELLVVISIIGLLSSIVLASLKDARNNAKNKAYRAEVNQFITALELYRNDNNGMYPGESNTGVQSEFTQYRSATNTAQIF